ncbi:hypothetical protein DsansV1_C20g0165101 [Dioscorea sansibarensis]
MPMKLLCFSSSHFKIEVVRIMLTWMSCIFPFLLWWISALHVCLLVMLCWICLGDFHLDLHSNVVVAVIALVIGCSCLFYFIVL